MYHSFKICNKVENARFNLVATHTDSITSSIFKEICEDANVPYQDLACRADMICGKTLGGISQSHVSIDSIDIELPQLAIHCANKTISTKDVTYMYKSLLEFYNTPFIKNKEGGKHQEIWLDKVQTAIQNRNAPLLDTFL